MTNLHNKTALITGASAPHGIGRAIAETFANAGAQVVLTDIETAHTQPLFEQAIENITGHGGTAIALPLDVTSQEQIDTTLSVTRKTFGPVDILVNNAGSLAGSDAFLHTTPEEWDTSFRVNLLGPMRLIQAVLPEMIVKGEGRILNIGSTGSLGAEPGFGAYTAMKHGLAGLSKTIAAEFGPQGILCNTICPGYIDTDMHQAANARLSAEQGVSLAEIKAARYADVALRRAGNPQDVANAALYLAGSSGAYVTGINLPVTGGVPFGI